MRELYANLFNAVHVNSLEPIDARVITTNGDTNRFGEAVMGRGVAKIAATLWPSVPSRLALLLEEHGTIVTTICETDGIPLVAFPVKHHWNEKADIDLIGKSCIELTVLATLRGWKTVIMPRPGCGNGGLDWDYVRPVLTPYLDDRFVVLQWPPPSR